MMSFKGGIQTSVRMMLYPFHLSYIISCFLTRTMITISKKLNQQTMVEYSTYCSLHFVTIVVLYITHCLLLLFGHTNLNQEEGDSSFDQEELWADRNGGVDNNCINDNCFQLENMTASEGFAVSGATANEHLGAYLGSACDFNHDGISDIIIGAESLSSIQARAYVIYGGRLNNTGSFTSFDLANMTEEQGFVIYFPDDPRKNGGAGVKCVGDINQDGVEDIILAAYLTEESSGTVEGAVVAIYGKPGGYSSFFIANMTSDQGFIISGVPWANYIGVPISEAGDINQDGIQDFIFGSPLLSNEEGVTYAGKAYVIYGKSGLRSSISLADGSTGLPSDQGFFIDGEHENGILGAQVSSAGDFNHDGIPDIIVGAPGELSLSGQIGQAGRTYVIYGKQGGYSSVFVKNLTSDQGFVIYCEDGTQVSGFYAGSIGDFNNDGISDIFVAILMSNLGYVLYGKSGGYSSVVISPLSDTENLHPDQGFLVGNSSSGEIHRIGIFVSSGDFNQDGISDLFLGAPLVNVYTGRAYVIYGKQGGGYSSIDPALMSADQGLIFYGPNQRGMFNGALTGYSGSVVGDFNNDGAADFMIGSPRAQNPSSDNKVGKAYIIYGLPSNSSTPSPSPSIGVSSSPTPLTTSPSPTPLRNETGYRCPFRVFNGMDIICSSELGKTLRVSVCCNSSQTNRLTKVILALLWNHLLLLLLS